LVGEAGKGFRVEEGGRKRKNSAVFSGNGAERREKRE
jgi:hypothetical protein